MPALRRYARSLARDVELSLDLTQETLLRAWKHRSRYREGTNLKAWMFRILRNLFLTHLRRGRTVQMQAFADGDPEIPVGAGQETRVMLTEVEAGWRRLNDDQQQALTLIAIEGRSFEEAAALANVPQGTLKSRVSRARRTLGLYLDGELAPPVPDLPEEREPDPVGSPTGSAVDRIQADMLRAYRARRSAWLQEQGHDA